MDLKKMLLISNPRSGHGAINIYMPEVLRVFEESDYFISLYRMRRSGDACEIAEQEGPNVDLLVCAGGDGTLNSVISGVMQIEPEKRPDIGFIPTGSTNDTRNSYKLPVNIVKAAEVAVTGEPFAVDIGQCGDRYFSYVASFGELSAVSAFTSQVAKNLLGRGAYIAEGLKALLKMESNYIRVSYDDNVLEGDYFLGMVTNSHSVGGFEGIAGKNVDLQDGLFEVTLVKKPADITEFSKEVQSMFMTANVEDDTAGGLITRFKASRVLFESEDNVQWVVDGEDAGRHQKIEVINHPRAVNIISGFMPEEEGNETEE